jgi:branched-chain amino acid transport system substrate-binding protein
VSEKGEVRRGVTRRDVIRGTAATGGLGLLAGGGIGYLLGNGSDETASGSGAAIGGGPPLKLIAAVDNSVTFGQQNEEIVNGARMAVDEINDRGGILGRPVEVEAFDIGSLLDPAQVRTGFTRIVAQKPAMVFTQGVIPPGPDVELTADAGVLYLHYSTQSQFVDMYREEPERFWSVFMLDPSEVVYGRGFATFVEQLVESGAYDPPAKTVAILGSDDAYGQAIAKAFDAEARKLGWEITSRETTNFGKTIDWGPIFAPIRSDPPALVFSTNAGPQDNITMARQWVRSPMPSLLYQQFAPSTAEYQKAVGDAADGILWATVLGIQSDEMGDAFRARYEERYNKSAGLSYTGAGYDAVRLWAKAAALAGDPADAEKVAPMIEQTIHRGVTGGMSFPSDHTVPSYPSQTPDPSLGQGHFIAQIKDGKSDQIFPDPYAVRKFELPPWMS